MLLSESLLLETNVCGIYAFHNLKNNKYYIGQSKNIRKRILRHLNNAKNGKNYPLYSAINHYGKENFECFVIETIDAQQLDEREKYGIEYYDSYNNGYNLTTGGKGVEHYKITSAIKKKISEGCKGRGSKKVYAYDISTEKYTEFNSRTEFGEKCEIKTSNMNITVFKDRGIAAFSKEELNEKIAKGKTDSKRPKRSFSSEEIHDLQTMLRKDFLTKYNVKPGTYHVGCRKFNIKNGHAYKITDEELQKEIDAGLTIPQIAEKYKIVSYSHLYKRYHKLK